MADKIDVFISVCSDALKAEDEVKDRLAAGAEKYLGVIGVLLGFQVVKMQDLSFSGGATQLACSVAALLGLGLLFVALALILWGMRVREYPTFPESAVLKKLNAAPTYDAAGHLVANVYLDLRDSILAINEKRAATYKIAGMVLLAGVLLTVFGQVGLGLKL
jgi:hypothetical protein